WFKADQCECAGAAESKELEQLPAPAAARVRCYPYLQRCAGAPAGARRKNHVFAQLDLSAVATARRTWAVHFAQDDCCISQQFGRIRRVAKDSACSRRKVCIGTAPVCRSGGMARKSDALGRRPARFTAYCAVASPHGRDP